MTLSPAMPLSPDDAPLWTPAPARAAASLLMDFKARIEGKAGKELAGYDDLWQWSVDNIPEFWSECWDYCGVIGDKGAVALADGDKMPGAQFFPQSRLNYAENLLRRRDDKPAIIFRDETGGERILTTAQLYDQVSLWAQAFRAAGLTAGDRVAGYMPNMPETIIAMLAASSLGAIWSSASPDFGVQGLVDRFGQIQPKILVAADGYYYNGKTLDCLDKVREAQAQIEGLGKTIIVPFVSSAPDVSTLKNAMTAPDFIGQYRPSTIDFMRLPFNHPLFIMFSSGTTGKPKCIVHGQGGTLLQHLKEHKLQSDIRPGDKIFYFTTCGWMMWNWLVSGLAAEACLMLYDGSPFYPDGTMLWAWAEKHRCDFFGTSAKYIDALKSEGIRPVDKFDLSCVKTIASTGSPLVHESFDYVYASVKKDVHLASISGGTDIVSCFMLGNPISPVWRGELQGAGLGMAVNILNEEGQVLPAGSSGELVCLKPFPCMPVGFWNDEDGRRYHEAYFDRFPNIWCHGDWVEKTLHNGFIIHGRSDATLNPGGVRIGTAEIYRQVEQIEAVAESIAVGQDWQGDVRVILFVRLKPGFTLDEALEKEIKTRIRTGASPRHVPARIIAVADIPRTKSGKITELAVRDIICGRPIRNKEALANPEALDLYKDLDALKN